MTMDRNDPKNNLMLQRERTKEGRELCILSDSALRAQCCLGSALFIKVSAFLES